MTQNGRPRKPAGDTVAVAIPARFASTRLPGKMLIEIAGKPLIRYVWERALSSRLAGSAVVATDDERIRAAVEGFGGHAEMTSADCASGTDRIAELVRTGRLEASIIVNVQGDEPEIDPAHIDMAASLLLEDPRADISTLAAPVATLAEYQDPNAVKAVVGADGFALYFSRASVPFIRDGANDDTDFSALGVYRHIGLYAYRKEALLSFAGAGEGRLERIERLEQLRALEMGLRIKVGLVESACIGIDTEKDLREFEKRIRNRKESSS